MYLSTVGSVSSIVSISWRKSDFSFVESLESVSRFFLFEQLISSYQGGIVFFLWRQNSAKNLQTYWLLDFQHSNNSITAKKNPMFTCLDQFQNFLSCQIDSIIQVPEEKQCIELVQYFQGFSSQFQPTNNVSIIRISVFNTALLKKRQRNAEIVSKK